MAGALGINIRLLYTLVFGLGTLLAGLAGVMAGPILAVEAGMGESILILTFVVIVIGVIYSVPNLFPPDYALQIRAELPDVGILVLSQYVEEQYATELLGANMRQPTSSRPVRVMRRARIASTNVTAG